MEAAELRGREFLKFVGKNEVHLRRNLAKNVTYDKEILEEVFSYTILRVYESILSGRTRVKDFEQYFYIASRNNYLKISERLKKRKSRQTGLFAASSHLEEEDGPNLPGIEELHEVANEKFGEIATDIYFGYLTAKAQNGRTSYKLYARKLGIPTFHVVKACREIKKYLRQHYGVDQKEK